MVRSKKLCVYVPVFLLISVICVGMAEILFAMEPEHRDSQSSVRNPKSQSLGALLKHKLSRGRKVFPTPSPSHVPQVSPSHVPQVRKINVLPAPLTLAEKEAEERSALLDEQNRLFLHVHVVKPAGLKNMLEHFVVVTQKIVEKQKRVLKMGYLTPAQQERLLAYATKVLSSWPSAGTEERLQKLKSDILRNFKRIEAGRPYSGELPPRPPMRYIVLSPGIPAITITVQDVDQGAAQDVRDLELEERQEETVSLESDEEEDTEPVVYDYASSDDESL